MIDCALKHGPLRPLDPEGDQRGWVYVDVDPRKLKVCSSGQGVVTNRLQSGDEPWRGLRAVRGGRREGGCGATEEGESGDQV